MTTNANTASTDGREEPPPVDLDDIAEWIRLDRRLTAQLDAAQARLDKLRAELGVDEITAARDAVRARIQERMGDAWEGRVNGRPVIRWRPHKATTTFDSVRFRKEHPDLWAQYQKPKKAPRPFMLLDPADGAS